MTFSTPAELPAAFARIVADGIPGIIRRQEPDGSIGHDPQAPKVYPQQAILPLAFCWSGLDPEARFKHSKELAECIARLGQYLVSSFNERGEFAFDSFGYKIQCVDQRLTYAWTEALRILREGGGPFEYERWGDKIERACRGLIEHHLKNLVGVRRFISRIMGTSTNHVALDLSTVFRAGQVLNRPELCQVVLPIARALAQDVHPDGYWDEHSDLLRSAGPTTLYNYLTQMGMAVMYELTKEPVFFDAIGRSARFHGNFCYPDGTPFDLIDERVRYCRTPQVWGLFALSHTPEGRGAAAVKFEGWRNAIKNIDTVSAEMLARHCENFLYWHPGPSVTPSFQRPDHCASLTLPAAIYRRGPWCIGLSAMRATNLEDPIYRANPFALERQKLVSVFHERVGLIINGSHSKNQPEASSFNLVTPTAKSVGVGGNVNDAWPLGGRVGEEGGELVVRANYRSFAGSVRVRVLNAQRLELTYEVDPAACRGPYSAGFTLHPWQRQLEGLNGQAIALADDPLQISSSQLGGGFRLGEVLIYCPESTTLRWPLLPYNSYAADQKSTMGSAEVRLTTELSIDRRSATFVVAVG